MKLSVKEAINSFMDQITVEDTRQQAKVKFPLLPSLFAIIIAWCSNCRNAVEVADYLESKGEYLSNIIEGLPGDISMSHDTVLRLLKTVRFSELQYFLTEFCKRVEQYSKAEKLSDKRVLSLDGQTPRAMEYEVDADSKSPQDRRMYNRQYYVTLYDSTNRMSIAQDEVQSKENENKSCVRLLSIFSLAGSIVTADALNTQRAVAEKIIQMEGEYCLVLKGNHEKLKHAVELAFSGEDDPLVPMLNREVLLDYDSILKTYRSEAEVGHGRIEERVVEILPANIIKPRILGEWKKDCECIVKATTFAYDKKYRVQKEPLKRYYLCSINPEDKEIAATVYRCIREHWHIENSLHWCLDMDFGQDLMQVKSREYARNRILLDKIALNVQRTVQPHVSKKSETISVSRLQKKLRDKPELAVRGLVEYFKNGTES